jgi:hypothetical protein
VRIVDTLTKVIEKETEIQKLAVDGENVINYFNENPEKKKKIIDKCYKLRDEIIDLDIPNAYKDSMVGSINKYINKLDPSTENKNSDLLYGILGFFVGVAIIYGGDKLMKILEEGVAEGFYKGMGYENE